MTAIRVLREDAGSVPTFVVAGDVDAMSAAQLSATICAARGCAHVLVDLSQVEAFESGALNDVILAARMLGRGLHVVCSPAAPARSLFDVIGVGEVYASCAEAIIALRL
jgi:anti-anti-sigma regulatory factor